MKKVITTEKLPIKLWLDDIEDGALEQAKNLANLPFAFKHIAIMPDSHQGYGMPIGGVLATKRAIIPNAVGVDIGCGMCSLKTNIKSLDKANLENLVAKIQEAVPVGFNHHSTIQSLDWMPEFKRDLPIVQKEFQKARYQVGTLGGGNHFIEIQKGSDGYIWIMIHSGSRNLGFKVAKHYSDLAIELNKQWYSNVPKDLAFFPLDSKEFHLYMDEMTYCINFALSNRKLMMERVKESITDIVPDVVFSDFINKPHNFAAWENHFNDNVIVHRKGATRAREGELGMIPGSQGTSSYIVVGKGKDVSFKSCSHGAGRTMSRTKARKSLDIDKEVKALNDMGVIHSIKSEKDLDEAPSSYKNIETVMDNQKDLVDIKIELKPLAVVKG